MAGRRFDLFSKDNWQSDKMERDAEAYDPAEEETGQPDEDLGEEPWNDELEEDTCGDDWYQEETLIHVTVGCSVNVWWEEDRIAEADYDAWVEKMHRKHADECDCGTELPARNFSRD
jgi:hypothetical protein